MDSVPTLPAVLLLGSGYAVLFLLERALPLRHAKKRLLGRLAVNLVVSAAVFAVAAVLVQPAAAAALDLLLAQGQPPHRLAVAFP